MALALDSASDSVLSSEPLITYTQCTLKRKNSRGANLAWAESGTEAVVSKRAKITKSSAQIVKINVHRFDVILT